MKEIIKTSPEHEKEFRETWKLRDEVANDPYWQTVYEYAATTKLNSNEINVIGPMLERKK